VMKGAQNCTQPEAWSVGQDCDDGGPSVTPHAPCNMQHYAEVQIQAHSAHASVQAAGHRAGGLGQSLGHTQL
jgi:hypothetical protein